LFELFSGTSNLYVVSDMMVCVWMELSIMIAGLSKACTGIYT
jgi:hypothetical protein